MTDNLKTLLELVQAHPNLPVVPIVDGEIFGDCENACFCALKTGSCQMRRR